jgi:DNA topoisomerase-1
MAHSLLLVESPAKAKTLSAMLGPSFRVRATMGHILDLPPNGLGVDRNTLTPELEPIRGKKSVLPELRKAAKGALRIYLATDPDREGEAIAWHLCRTLRIDPRTPCRVTYHEITQQAVKKALSSPRPVDLRLVMAQQARRVLDRVVGYTVSPKLWDRLGDRHLSAGRVQTPALRLVVERHRAIVSFEPVTHYGAEIECGITATWDTKPYRKSEDEPYVLDRRLAEEAASVQKVTVEACRDTERTIHPKPPHTTSSLQQEAYAKLRMPPAETMKLAQELFEKYHAITYHRTDSVHLAPEAVAEIRAYAQAQGWPIPQTPPVYKARMRNAQEAHEAIRPTNVSDLTPSGVTGRALALYRLIHQRAVVSQLAPLVLSVRTISLLSPGKDFRYTATGRTVLEPGFTVLTGAVKETRLPEMKPGTVLAVTEGRVTEHQTEPPPRYTEGSLVAELEKRGIGRPSTWAAILSNIVQRGYVEVRKDGLHPTDKGMRLVDALCRMRFADYGYTGEMEERLDAVAGGEASYESVVRQAWRDLEADIAEHLVGR